MRNIKRKLGKLQSNMTLRYLGLTSLFIVGIQTLFAVGQVRWAYQQKLESLEERVGDIGNLLGAFRQESTLTLDDTTLARLLNQLSLEEELVYGIVQDAQGAPIGIFLNKKSPVLPVILQNEPTKNLELSELINTLNQDGKVREIRQPILVDNHKIGQIRIGYVSGKIHQEIFNQAENTLIASVCLSGILIAIIYFLFSQEIYLPLQNLVGWAKQETHKTIDIPEEEFINEIEFLKWLIQTLSEKQDLLDQQHLSSEQESQTSLHLLQQESLAKSQFLAMVGHELRTPLNAVTGMTGLLLDTKLTNQQREFINIIRNSGETLLTMINNILDFAKIEANKLELEETPFELGQSIEEALHLFVPQASERKLELAYLIEPHTPNAIIGDVTRLKQILVNLLSNAVKFTESGEVVVYVNATPVTQHPVTPQKDKSSPLYEIRFAVKDSGIGIPREKMDRLFKSFSQVDASTSRKYGGTGLGLAISKRLTEMMGGKMWFHSVEGKGSTFYFTVIAQAAPSSSLANSPSAEEMLGGKRMLIVDDIITNQKILTHQANSWGMLTCSVQSAPKALEWLKQGWAFDVVILDMNMPKIDGLTLAQEIRNLPHCKRLPLVLLSSLGKPEMTEKVEKIEFAAILTKPIQQAQLYDVLVRVLREKPIIVNHGLTDSEHPRLADTLPLRILVAEDINVNQEVIRLQLEKLGYLPDIVSNGVEVLEALRRHPYDVILMDVRMPEMDGMSATHQIRKEWMPNVRPRIIAMTADAMQGDREKCLESGMDDYISKPIRLEELHRAISKCSRILDKPPAIDRKILKDLQQMAGQRAAQVLKELIKSYLEDTPNRLEAISLAIRENNSENLRQETHGLRSASLQLGAIQLAHLCQELETLARGGTVLGATEKLSVITTEYQRVCQTLNDEIQQIQFPLTPNSKNVTETRNRG